MFWSLVYSYELTCQDLLIFFFTFRFCFFAEEAERIMKEEYSILQLPAGIPDFKSIEEARLKAEGKSS